jgi:glutathione S-transferase
MFAALNTLEPAVLALAEIDLFNADADWARQRRPAVLERLETRLRDLDRVLQERDFLVGQFTAADILMATVLNILRHTELVAAYPALHRYHQRCLARPAARRAMAAQLAQYAEAPQAA